MKLLRALSDDSLLLSSLRSLLRRHFRHPRAPIVEFFPSARGLPGHRRACRWRLNHSRVPSRLLPPPVYVRNARHAPRISRGDVSSDISAATLLLRDHTVYLTRLSRKFPATLMTTPAIQSIRRKAHAMRRECNLICIRYESRC